IAYGPGSMFRTWYWPWTSLLTLRDVPRSPVRLTLASGTPLPDGSVTRPRTEPAWLHAGNRAAASIRTHARRYRRVRMASLLVLSLCTVGFHQYGGFLAGFAGVRRFIQHEAIALIDGFDHLELAAGYLLLDCRPGRRGDTGHVDLFLHHDQLPVGVHVEVAMFAIE